MPGLITVGAPIDDGIKDGVYRLTCTGVEAKIIEGKPHPQYNPNGDPQPVFIWKFVFTGTDREVEGVTSQMTGPKAKASRYISALLGPEALQPGANYDAPDFVGKECLGQIEHNASGYARVSDLFALPQEAAPPPATVPAPAVTAAPGPAPVPPQAEIAAQAGAVEAPPAAAPAPAPAPEAAPAAAPQSVRAQAGEEDDLPF